MRKVAIFVILVFASAIFVPVVAAEDNLVTGQVTRTFGEVKSSLPKLITETVLGPAGTPVYEIKFDTNTQLLQVRISLEGADIDSAGISTIPGGLVYSYFNVSGKNVEDADLDYLKIKFRVNSSWMESNGVSPSDVRLLKFSSGQWDVVSLAILDQGEDSVSYEASPDGFAIFAISGESATVTSVPEQTGGAETIEEPAPAEETTEAPAQQGTEVQEVNQQHDITQDDGGDMTWIVVGAVVVIAVASLFLIPASVLKKIKKRHHRHPWKTQ